jgi:hypothetical protein
MADLTRAGAAAGTAIMPGIGTAIGGLFGSLLSGNGSGGATSSPAGPSRADASAAIYGSGLDGSNWSVNFAGVQGTAGTSGNAPAMSVPGLGAIPNWAFIAIGAVVIWKMSHSKK